MAGDKYVELYLYFVHGISLGAAIFSETWLLMQVVHQTLVLVRYKWYK